MCMCCLFCLGTILAKTLGQMPAIPLWEMVQKKNIKTKCAKQWFR